MKPLTLRLPDDLWQILRAYAYTHEQRYNTIVVDSLRAYLVSSTLTHSLQSTSTDTAATTGGNDDGKDR